MTTADLSTPSNDVFGVSSQPAGSESQPPQSNPSEINVGTTERQISLLGGAALVLLGLSRRSLPGLGLAALGGALLHRGVTGTCSLYSALGVNSAKDDPGARPQEYFQRGIHVEQVVTISRSPEELFTFWRDFKNLPRFMRHLNSVEILDGNRSRWIARGPAGTSVKWDAEIINEVPNALIAWRSVGAAEVDNAGSVRFINGAEGRGTEVHVVIDYIPPAGSLGAMVAKLFGEDPETQIREDLRSFKSLMETGEIPTTEGQSQGNG